MTVIPVDDKVIRLSLKTKKVRALHDIFWLKDKSFEDTENLPEPDVLAQEIAYDLQAALEQFSAIADELKE